MYSVIYSIDAVFSHGRVCIAYLKVVSEIELVCDMGWLCKNGCGPFMFSSRGGHGFFVIGIRKLQHLMERFLLIGKNKLFEIDGARISCILGMF